MNSGATKTSSLHNSASKAFSFTKSGGNGARNFGHSGGNDFISPSKYKTGEISPSVHSEKKQKFVIKESVKPKKAMMTICTSEKVKTEKFQTAHKSTNATPRVIRVTESKRVKHEKVNRAIEANTFI